MKFRAKIDVVLDAKDIDDVLRQLGQYLIDRGDGLPTDIDFMGVVSVAPDNMTEAEIRHRSSN